MWAVGGLALGLLAGWLLFSKGRPALSASADHSNLRASSSQPPQPPVGGNVQKDAASVSETEGFIRVPVALYSKVFRQPLGVSLMPEGSLLHALGISETTYEQVSAAFLEFKRVLEECEFKNRRLIKQGDGEFYEIQPFQLPPSAKENLKSKLTTALGRDDWRIQFLTGSMDSWAAFGGLGKYRQEISIETERDDSGGSFEMLNCRTYDAKNKIVNRYGFEVRPNKVPIRYSSLFNEKAESSGQSMEKSEK